MKSAKRIGLIGSIVLCELIVLGILITHFVSRGDQHTITPFSANDIATTTSRLHYYYDLSSEAHTFNPDWLTYTPVYMRNHDQLNDRFDYAVAKPAGVYRIETLGDSWAFGMFVSTKDNYSERLEDLLNDGLRNKRLVCTGIRTFEILNLGVGGYDIEYMLERLRLRGMKYDPDLVIPIIKIDDFILVNELFQKKLRDFYQSYAGDLKPHTVNGVAVNPKQDLSIQAEKEFRSEHSDAELDDYESKALNALDRFYTGAVLFFVYGQNLAPAQSAILERFKATHGSTYIYNTSARLLPNEKVPHDEHPGITGHQRFAEELYHFLVDTKVIPCQMGSGVSTTRF